MTRAGLVRALSLAAVVVAAPGCLPPGAGTIVERGMAEVRGGWGEAREARAFPPGPIMDRFRSVKVGRVERSADASPMPPGLPKVIETELRTRLSDPGLFAGGAGPTLVIRTRLTAHWRTSGLASATGAPSEILARVEFFEEGRGAPLGVYYVRGVSGALARNSDEDLGRGLASGIVDLIESRRTPPREPAPPEVLPR